MQNVLTVSLTFQKGIDISGVPGLLRSHMLLARSGYFESTTANGKGFGFDQISDFRQEIRQMTLARRILIVEDMPTQSLRMQHLLINAQVEAVSVVYSGSEAIDLLKTDTEFDAIISDIDMPEMNGFQLCQAVKKMEGAKEIPFFVLVSLKTPLDAVHAIESGADNILLKDYNKEYFVEQLTTALLNAHPPDSEKGRMHCGGQWFDVNVTTAKLAAMVASTFAMAMRERAQKLRESAKVQP